ncbi:NUDIX domain-containing protein [Flavobacterium sp. NST-5]|uniref:NUDIX domain-containing protein n=1 Tax=Flavobacterium ichthyis TaxID=2698827 RepID=A0ABW9Z8Z8_9FLAO|nr:CoA pyrophosphatase [Flavobacterium ichthyis]NBL65363.1 NUDIX domain-containing protein [Flavobacterium ichthyis]
MKYSEFVKFLPKITNLYLPGFEAHAKMAPLDRIATLKPPFFSENIEKAAVMMFFYPKNNEIFLALILRNSYRGVHSSQIAFPGGKVELSDVDLEQTALRETFEEIGINKDSIEVIRQFSEIFIPPSNFVVTPFLGLSHSEIIFNPSEREVAGMIEVSIDEILDDANVSEVSLTTSYAENWEVPAFKFGEFVVWGATAMMLNELKEVIKSALE